MVSDASFALGWYGGGVFVGAAAFEGGGWWSDIEVDVEASDAGVDCSFSSTWRNWVEIWCREEILFLANVYSDI